MNIFILYHTNYTLNSPEILINLGADVNMHVEHYEGENYTPLHDAVVAVINNGHKKQDTFPLANYLETCALLIEKGANVNSVVSR